jgi:hypothetical protein
MIGQKSAARRWTESSRYVRCRKRKLKCTPQAIYVRLRLPDRKRLSIRYRATSERLDSAIWFQFYSKSGSLIYGVALTLADGNAETKDETRGS